MVDASWAAVQPILDYRANHPQDFPNYDAGSWGPKAAEEMLERTGPQLEAAMTTAAAVDPERLLKELRALWRDLSKQDPNGVLRACAMTLIVVLEEEHDAGPITRNHRAADA